MTIESKPSKPIRASFAPRHDERGPRTRVLVSGVHARDLDLTANVTGAIAHALWQARGGDSVSNWSEAERILEQLAGVSVRPAPLVPISPEPAEASAPEPVGTRKGGEVVVPARRRMAR